ncbi:MAG: NNP family nitrate/nitrite transporter-like MFS transporter, partial [Paracoccaceae bacterium]
DVFFTIGVVVTIASVLAFFLRFSPEQEAEEKALFEKASMDLLQIRADRANEALRHSAHVVAEYNKTHDQKI